MSCTGTSKDFALRYAAKLEKRVITSSADLYGGGTNPTTGANDLMRFDEATITDTPEQFEDVSSTGNMATRNDEVSAVPVAVTYKSKVYTNGIEPVLFNCFGREEITYPVNYSTTEYSHLFALQPCGKDQRAYTSAEQSQAAAHTPSYSPAYASTDRINSYMELGIEQGPADVIAHNVGVSEFTISADAKAPLIIEATGTAEGVTRDTSKTASANWTEKSGSFGSYFMLRHATCEFGQIGSASAVDIFSFAVKVGMGVAEDLFPTGTTNSGLSRAEPLSTDKLDVEITFQINKHDTIDYTNLEQAGTLCQWKVDFTRGANRFILLAPSIQVISAEPEISDGSKINITAKAHFSTATDPFTTERSISGTEMVLTDATMPLYLVTSNQVSENMSRE